MKLLKLFVGIVIGMLLGGIIQVAMMSALIRLNLLNDVNVLNTEIPLIGHFILMVICFISCKRWLTTVLDVLWVYIVEEIGVITLVLSGLGGFNGFYLLGFPIIMMAYDLILFFGLYCILVKRPENKKRIS